MVIVSARDQICSCSTFSEENGIEHFSKQPEVLSYYPSSNGIATNHTNLPPNDSPGEAKKSYTGVSCLNLWHWTWPKLHTTSCYLHPLRHAAMVAVESSAAMDRHPGTGHDGDKSEVENIPSPSMGTPAKRQKTDLANVVNSEDLDSCTEAFHPASARHYLCTGYDLPCLGALCNVCDGTCPLKNQAYILCFPKSPRWCIGQCSRVTGGEKLESSLCCFQSSPFQRSLETD